ncbi:hypothetical protein [Paraburkholderia nemoris]|uniref:hypothetical protein n=1 Tax=Paraburkholderia nemoris TaxID=2793076 RepID=UPI001B8B6649|nr:hypothetical protein [Paraburkholderia nemoris]
MLRDEQASKAWLHNVEAESFVFDGQWSAEVAFELLSVMTNVANFLGTTLTARQFSDV